MTSIGYELIVISACVLGGVSLKGGIGKISYVVAGVLLILGTVENAMNLLNISPFAQYVVRGLITAGGGDLRPLQAKSETHCLMLFSATILAYFPTIASRHNGWLFFVANGDPRHTVYTYMSVKPRSAQHNKKREGGEPGDRTVNRNP